MLVSNLGEERRDKAQRGARLRRARIPVIPIADARVPVVPTVWGGTSSRVFVPILEGGVIFFPVSVEGTFSGRAPWSGISSLGLYAEPSAVPVTEGGRVG